MSNITKLQKDALQQGIENNYGFFYELDIRTVNVLLKQGLVEIDRTTGRIEFKITQKGIEAFYNSK